MGQCEFLNNFFNVMRERNIVYTEDEQQNFKKLLNALENKEVEQVQIFNIPMGLGKSTFIKEYCKYK